MQQKALHKKVLFALVATSIITGTYATTAEAFDSNHVLVQGSTITK